MTRLAVVVLCVVAAGSPARADRLGFDPASVYKVPIGGGTPTTGPADAPVTIVVWSDFACGYCYRVQFTLDALERLYPGQIRLAHRTLPLDEDFTTTAEAALAAAAQGRFRPMSDRIYAVGGRLDRAGVELLARDLGLDMVRFRADLDTRKHKPQIDADVKDAVALGVSGTPTFFINGRPVHGNQPLKVFADVVDEELARAAKTPGGYDVLVGKGAQSADAAKQVHAEFELDSKATYKVGLGLAGHQLGKDDALVTVVVWGDFQCPFCAKLHASLAHVPAKYGDSVRVIYRHLAMRNHRYAAIAAEAAIAAADQGKFWAFHDRLYENFGALTRPELEQHAQAVGLDVAKFRAALDDRRYRDVAAAETASGEALGIDGTPTMFVNGTPVVGSKDEATIDKLIDTQLQQAKAAVATGGIAARDVYALVMSSAIGSERADPSRIPDASAAHVAPRAEDRGRSVAAACRHRETARAIELATGLTGPARLRARLVCESSGVDLPR
ncbi:MAG: thioredoxin domain-containing protein [Kofleriaceae bacterium]